MGGGLEAPRQGGVICRVWTESWLQKGPRWQKPASVCVGLQWDRGGPGFPGGDREQYAVCVCVYVQSGSLLVELNGGVSSRGHHQ